MSRGDSAFSKRVRRGRHFEIWERSRWNSPGHEGAKAEAWTSFKGRRGRIDLLLRDEEEGHSVVVETKATDWDSMAPHRVRPNALRHARQLWRYINAELEGGPVIPALVYPAEPITPGRKEEIEAILNERFIQVVWRELDLGAF
jgi:hypothetical protein